MYIRGLPNRLFFIWLALLLCVYTTADLVVDLAFEEQEVASTAHESGEDSDGVAEHLLMPSERAGVDIQNAVTTLQPPDFQIVALAIPVLELTAPRAPPPPHHPPRDKLVSFAIPLRI